MGGERPGEDARGGLLARLKAAGIHPRHRLGQNFLHDPRLLDSLLDEAGLEPGEAVFEVGTGPGTLTARLARRAARVLSVEVDPRLAEFARRELARHRGVEILERDVLQGKGRLDPEVLDRVRSLGEFRWISNLPYAVATPLIVSFLGEQLPWRRAALTLQLEVAQRLAASPGGASYGAVSAIVAYWARARVVRKVSSGSFWPRPNVESAVLVLEPDAPPGPPEVRLAYASWVHRLLRSPRKQIGAILRRALGRREAAELLARAGWSPEARPGSLGRDDFLWLARNFPPFSVDRGSEGP